MAASMFQNASNIRISGRPTFQQINGPYHYHDNTSNTTNNNTTNITGNDFSQTVNHNHSYTIGSSTTYREDTRTPPVPTGPGLVDPRVHRIQTAPALPYTNAQMPRSQSLPGYDTEYHSAAYTSSPVNGFENVTTTQHYASFQPFQILTMSPEVSAQMMGFFGDLGQQILRDDEDEGEGDYQDVPSKPSAPGQTPRLDSSRPCHPQSIQGAPDAPLYQPPTLHTQSITHPNGYSPPCVASPTFTEQQRPTLYRSPIPPRVRRTLQAAFAFNSNIGGQSNAPTHTSKTSTTSDFDAATTTASSLPFEYQSDVPQGVRLTTYTGSVAESRHTINTATHYDAAVSDAVPDGRRWDGDEYAYDVYEDERTLATT